eukprot:jgi/Orpsp1_1/1187742/evm.model.d7180000059823.1
MPEGGFPMPNDEMKNFNGTKEGFPDSGSKSSSSSDDEDSFKTKNATMIVELNGSEKSFNKITFSIGGSSSRSFGKQGYNLKIRGKDELYGRTQFRLRPDAREATYLRSKLVCDMHNRLGVPSISANYATLYINDEYMGFYILMDSIKLSWVEYEYGDEDSTTLYQCKDMNNDLTVKSSANGCTNENEDVTDNTEWDHGITILTLVTTITCINQKMINGNSFYTILMENLVKMLLMVFVVDLVKNQIQVLLLLLVPIILPILLKNGLNLVILSIF